MKNKSTIEIKEGASYLVTHIQTGYNSKVSGLQEVEILKVSEKAYKINLKDCGESNILWVLKGWDIEIIETLNNKE
jgi:hypothetical protein